MKPAPRYFNPPLDRRRFLARALGAAGASAAAALNLAGAEGPPKRDDSGADYLKVRAGQAVPGERRRQVEAARPGDPRRRRPPRRRHVTRPKTPCFPVAIIPVFGH